MMFVYWSPPYMMQVCAVFDCTAILAVMMGLLNVVFDY